MAAPNPFTQALTGVPDMNPAAESRINSGNWVKAFGLPPHSSIVPELQQYLSQPDKYDFVKSEGLIWVMPKKAAPRKMQLGKGDPGDPLTN